MSRRAFALLLVAVCAVAWLCLALRRPAGPDEGVRTASFPVRVAGYEGQDLPLTDRQYALLESRDVLFREYRNAAGEWILACVAVAGSNRKVAHPPEVCYQGQGWSIDSIETVSVRLHGRERSLQRLVIRHGENHQLVYSWYRVGSVETPSYLWQQALGLWEDVKQSGAPSALLRFSTAFGPSEEAAEERLRRWVDAFLPLADEALREPAP